MEYAVVIKKVNNNYIVIGHGEYEKLYKVYKCVNTEYIILEIDKTILEDIIHDSVKLQSKIEELIQKKNELDNMN